ncbi:MAG: hypothetical protein Q8917_17235 [Bacillota bacterium]|nr:hypothetical protein [Bacillota bacterium]
MKEKETKKEWKDPEITVLSVNEVTENSPTQNNYDDWDGNS